MRLYDGRRYDLERVGRYKYNLKLDVIQRLRTIAQGIPYVSNPTVYHYADDIKDKDGNIIVNKGDVVNLDSINVLSKNKDALRVKILDKEYSLQNETETHIFGVKTSDLNEQYAAFEINYIPSEAREVGLLVEKGTKITPEVRKLISNQKDNIVFQEKENGQIEYVKDPQKLDLVVKLYGEEKVEPLRYSKILNLKTILLII